MKIRWKSLLTYKEKKFSIKVCAIKLNLAIGSVSILKVKCTQHLKINLQKQQ